MSTTFDETFDYLTMLGLDPAAVRRMDVSALRDAIKAKKKEWTLQAINPLYQQGARANLERAKHFEQILSDPAALEAYVSYIQEVQAGNRKQQETEVARLVSLAVGVGDSPKSLTSGQRDLIVKEAQRRGLPADLVEDVLRARGLAIHEAPVIAATLPYQEPAMDSTLLAQINKHLHVLGKKSFYELLDVPVRTSPGKLNSIAGILYSKWSKALPKTNTCVAWEKSLQACMTYLKDEESKERYDRALFNERLDEFVWRIDLVLAGGKLARESHVQLAQAGVQEFGLTQALANQCITRRAAAKGVALSKPVLVTVKLQGQVQCARCHHWNPETQARCIGCGASLVQTCRNPHCGHAFGAAAKVCERCHLPSSKGAQFAALLQLIDASLNVGNARTALDACRLAQQILPLPALDERLERAGQVRVLAAGIRRAAARKQWTKVLHDLPQLLLISPNWSQPGVPQLEKITEHLHEIQQRMAQLPDSAEPGAAARFLMELLAQWTDNQELIHKLSAMTGVLDSQGDFETALEIVKRLVELQPDNADHRDRSVQYAQKVSVAREQTARREQALNTFQRSFAGRRLYAAERALQTLDELEATDDIAEDAASLRRQLAEIRTEIESIKQTSPAEISRDALIERYLSLLQRCRDCREALAALQNAAPESPSPPRGVKVAASGNRRLVSWQPPGEGKQPGAYVVQRSLMRPGSRQPEQQYVTVYEGTGLHFVDDEIVHSGTIVRYTVHSLLRGRLEVEGNLLQEYAVTSPPVFAEPLLVWQEVLGLRSTGDPRGVALHWHRPSGARQVVIERWPGGRDERPQQPDLLTATGESHLLDEELDEKQTYTYRMRCVYDGAQGEFITPGVTLTSAAGQSAVANASPTPAAVETPEDDGIAEILKHAPPETSPEAKAERGTLKRFGLWPPVRGS